MGNSPERRTASKQLPERSALWRIVNRIQYQLRWLPTQISASWNSQPTIEIRNELGKFTALPLSGTIKETDPSYQAHLHSWVTDAPAGTFIDVGAASGFFTRLATTKGSARKVFAFEPNPSLYALLLKNIADNNLPAEGFNAAITHQTGSLNLPPHSLNSGHTSSCSGRSSMHVRTFPLDTFLASKEVDPEGISFIRVVSEGHELSALAGMNKTLQSMQPGARVMIRIWGDGGESESLHGIMKRAGFETIERRGDYHLFEKVGSSPAASNEVTG